ncbi:transcriptional regulator, MarR family [Jannaschia faecimaris]|uniref:Transcriptional regulator, MarR family n=1 Tax=Jannaschia faecimaris TaxID=1244108 RepID=A0A1H3QLJ0_9RHOB|nr:MarR family transcriptional regulator [Jannaschia faecimaris]SDZ13599.1 transcriptional regulator, MarR family [Jannaschia faecimaris]
MADAARGLMFFLRDLPDLDMIAGFGPATGGADPDAILSQLNALRDASLRLRRIERFLSSHGFSQAQFLTIMVIVREPGRDALSPAEIAARLDVSRPVLSKMLVTMERNGLVTRLADKTDGRRSEISPTTEGRARFDALLPGYFEALMSPLPQT